MNQHTVFSFEKDFGIHFVSEDFSYILEDVKKGIEIEITTRQDSALQSKEGYTLQIEKQSDGLAVHIRYAEKKGAINALFAVRRMCRENRFVLGETREEPKFAVRGYIEGFYGRPWSYENRLKMLRYAASFGANTHYYAPKDDPYHRKLWREEYPENELMQLKVLSDEAAKYGMEFAYCIAPGLSICYASETDFSCLTKKLTQLYSIGIRSFGLLLDDIAPDLYYEEDKQKYGSIVEAHVDLINRTSAFMKALDGSVLTVCPTEYWGKGDSDYLRTLGQGIGTHIRIFFTGSDICAKEIGCTEAQTFFQSTNRKPLYWDNYPVNDAEMFMEMHMGPLIGRDKELYKYAQGEIFNCMEYVACTRIPLATALTYLWNPENYDPEQAYMQAVTDNIPEDEREAFILLADHLRTSCLKDENSHIMGENLLRCYAAREAGDIEKAKEIFNNYLTKMQHAAALLGSKKDGIYKELTIWIEKFILCVDILGICGEILFDNADKKVALRTKIHKYNRDAAVLTGFCFRELAEIALEDFTY